MENFIETETRLHVQINTLKISFVVDRMCNNYVLYEGTLVTNLSNCQ